MATESSNDECCPTTLEDAAIKGDLAECQALASTITDAADILKGDGALVCAFANGHTHVCAWLLNHFQLDKYSALGVLKNYVFCHMNHQLAQVNNVCGVRANTA
jgi:hypothetical protein